MQGPGIAMMDVRWSHEFKLTADDQADVPSLTIGVDAYNVVNRVNYAGYVGTLTSPFFSRAVAALPPRRVQLSVGFA